MEYDTGFPHPLPFLLIYLLFVFIFSYVGLPAEFAMGRRAATGTLGAYENAWATRGRSAGKAGGLLGWLPLAGSMCIAIGYAPGHHAGHRSDADLAAKEIEIAVDGVLDMLHDFHREAGPRHLRIHPAQRVVAEQRRPICAGEEG